MIRSLAAFALALCWPLALSAGPVVLTNGEGGLRIEGNLLSVEGEMFRVETAQGALTLDAGSLICEGAGCPDPESRVARAGITGPPGMVHNLVPTLLEVFADREGYAYRALFLSDEEVVWELRHPGTDRLLARLEGRVAGEDGARASLTGGTAMVALGWMPARAPVRQDVIALDAVLPLVAPENPRAAVTQAQLAALLAGDISNWSRLGGDDLPLTLHAQAGTGRLLRRWYDAPLADGTTIHGTPAHLSEAVASDPSALGIGLYSAIRNAAPLVVGGSCGLAIPATRDTIRAEDYPLTQPLFLQRIGARQPKILRDFIAYVRSAEAQPVIAAAGYVDQAIGRIAFDRQGDRIANAVLAAGEDAEARSDVQAMIAELLNRDRLTLTFRFEDGSSDLDPQSASNVGRLADAINSGAFDGKRLTFIGFSDGVGPADGNQRLSLRRARAVRRAVAAFTGGSGVPLEVAAFGERLPMACDDTAWGRQVNRRVEVWVE